MALVYVTRTSGLFLLLFLIINTSATSPPRIFNVKVNNFTCSDNVCVYKFDVNVDYEWSLTYEPAPRGRHCAPEFGIVKTGNVIELPNTEKRLYFCVKSPTGVWLSQGENLYLDSNDVIDVTEFER